MQLRRARATSPDPMIAVFSIDVFGFKANGMVKAHTKSAHRITAYTTAASQ